MYYSVYIYIFIYYNIIKKRVIILVIYRVI